MKDDQKNIYYISGDDKDSLLKSPSVEKLLEKDIEIIFMTDSVDEYTVSSAALPPSDCDARADGALLCPCAHHAAPSPCARRCSILRSSRASG